MLVALWDSPAADCLESAARSLSWMVERCDGVTCDALVRARQVDLGLVPAYHVLAAGGEVQVLPGGALSSWSFPHAQLQLSRPLQQVRTFACTPSQAQEALMVRVILKEHYGVDAMPVAGDSADATLHSGSACEALQASDTRLNLGQEWFELLQYPMVWALFVCASGSATAVMMDALKSLTSRAEEQLREQDGEFIRLRLDDLALAGLTGLREYLYYYGAIEEMAELPYYQPDEAGISEPLPPWAI